MSAIAYIDESGDHGLHNINPDFPVLTVAAVVINDKHIAATEQAFNNIRRSFFGNEEVILHSAEVRRRKGFFRCLEDDNLRLNFYTAFNSFITEAPFSLITVTIRKDKLVGRYPIPENPYCLALKLLMERLAHFGQNYHPTRTRVEPIEIHMIAESRGRVEDEQLLTAFAAYRQSGTAYTSADIIQQFCAVMEVRTKKANIPGLQIADMCAYPIARYVMGQGDERTMEVLSRKIYGGNTGNIAAYGLKVFPPFQRVSTVR